MPVAPSRQEINPTLDQYSFDPVTAQTRRSMSMRISPYLKKNGTDFDDFTGVTNIILKVAPKTNVLAVLFTKTVTSLYAAGTGGGYDEGAGCCDFDCTSAEMALDLTGGDGTSRVFAFMFYMTLTSGELIPMGQLDLKVYEDPAALSLTPLGSNQQNARVTTAGILQLRNPDSGLYHPVWIENDGTIGIGAGGS